MNHFIPSCDKRKKQFFREWWFNLVTWGPTQLEKDPAFLRLQVVLCQLQWPIYCLRVWDLLRNGTYTTNKAGDQFLG